MEISQPNLHIKDASLGQSSMFVPPNSQKETAMLDPASNYSEYQKAIAAIYKDYDLCKWDIDRYCEILHKHVWDLERASKELLKCSQNWMKKDGFKPGRIKEILDRIKHDLELIYIPRLVSTDIKLEDSEQSTSKEPLFISQPTMKSLHCKRPRVKTLAELDVDLNKGKGKFEIEMVKRNKVAKLEAPDKVNGVKILEVRKVLYQFHLYNLSHLLSVASSGGTFFKMLTHDLIVQTVKMMSERQKISALKSPSSVDRKLCKLPPPTEQDLSVLLCNEVSTMASHLISKLDSYLVASDFAQNKNSNPFIISRTQSSGTTELGKLGLELKWMYFDKVLQAIHSKLRANPVSIQSANEVELIVDSKLLHGNFDFSDDHAVLTFIGALKRYVQLVCICRVSSHNKKINETMQSIMCELETVAAQLEQNATEVHKKVVDISKIHIRAQNRVSSIKHCLDRAIVLQRSISDFQSRISMYVKHLVVDLEQAQKESFEMHVQHQDAARLAESVLIQPSKKAEQHKKKLCAQLGDLKHNAREVMETKERELKDLVLAILGTKVEEECDVSGVDSDAAAPSGLPIDSHGVNEAV